MTAVIRFAGLKNFIIRLSRLSVLFPVFCGGLLVFLPQPARAQSCESCICVIALEPLVLWNIIENNHDDTRDHVVEEFERHRQDFMIDYFFRRLVLPNLVLMTEQIVTTAMHQMMILGTLFDAREHMQFMRLQQLKTAEAHKDYHPSTGMCTIGTMTRSLAVSQMKADLAAHGLSERSMDRQLGNRASIGSDNAGQDIADRFKTARNRFCDPAEHDGLFDDGCRAGDPNPAAFRNRDLNYTQTVDTALTVNLDSVDQDYDELSNNTDVFALATNLYAHRIAERIVPKLLERVDNQGALMRFRQLLAKRSVAEHSFNTIVGMKTEGGSSSADTGSYMASIYRQLGLEDEDDIETLLGENPSYHAQMEVLTKKLYQRPEFYTNLYDKPANVARKGAALRAIGLMQNMDRFKSQLRSEMLMAVLLELKLMKEQQAIQDRLGDLTPD